MFSDNRFIVAWDTHYDVYAKIYGWDLETIVNEFRVNSYTANYQQGPAIGVFKDDKFVIVWHSNQQTARSKGVYGQRYHSNGI